MANNADVDEMKFGSRSQQGMVLNFKCSLEVA